MAQPVIDYAAPALPRPRTFSRGIFGWFLFGALCITVFLLLNGRGPHTAIPLSDFRGALLKGNVLRVTVNNDRLVGQFRSPLSYAGVAVSDFAVDIPKDMASNWQFIDWLLTEGSARGATIDVDNAQNLILSIVVQLIPWVLIFAFIWFFVLRQLRKGARPAAEPVRVVVVNPPETASTSHGG